MISPMISPPASSSGSSANALLTALSSPDPLVLLPSLLSASSSPLSLPLPSFLRARNPAGSAVFSSGLVARAGSEKGGLCTVLAGRERSEAAEEEVTGRSRVV